MIYFDLTTSSQWGGRSVGIVRVERELFRALRIKLGADQVVPVIFHNATKLFYRLRPDVIDLVSTGHAVVDFKIQIDADIAAGLSAAFDHPSVDYVSAYRLRLAEEWVRENFLSRAPSFQEEWLTRPVIDSAGEKKWFIPFLSAVSDVLTPGSDSTIFSAGLDWDYKDLRAIRILKTMYKFRYVSFVYDMVPVKLPQFVVPAIRDKISAFFADLMWTADAFVCSAQSVTHDLLDFGSAMTGKALEIAQIPFGIPARIQVPPKRQASQLADLDLVSGDYALYVSTVEPRKNHRTLYLAWKRGIESGQIDPDRHKLVFLGMAGWLSHDLMNAIADDRSLKGSIVVLSGLSDEAVDVLYQHCRFTVFPSFAEGYGLAIAESHAHGKWVLASSRPAIPEVAGKMADYLDPDDILGWAASMASHFDDASDLADKEARLSKKTPISWAQSAQNLLQSAVLRPQAPV